jgi:hypothetical protein
MVQHANHVGEPVGLDAVPACRHDSGNSAHVG